MIRQFHRCKNSKKHKTTNIVNIAHRLRRYGVYIRGIKRVIVSKRIRCEQSSNIINDKSVAECNGLFTLATRTSAT